MFKILQIIVVAMFAFDASADPGPTNIGPISIGMSKESYLAAANVKGVDCNAEKNAAGEKQRTGLGALRPDNKALCWSFLFAKVASVETVTVNGVSYDVISTDYDVEGFLDTIGHNVEAVFLDDRLVSLEIYSPKVDIKTLTSKYGAPKLNDNQKVDYCKNAMGAEFNNKVGDIDAVWQNGEVQAIYRIKAGAPRRTCTDGITLDYYILQEPKKVQVIDLAINAYLKSLEDKKVQGSLF